MTTKLEIAACHRLIRDLTASAANWEAYRPRTVASQGQADFYRRQIEQCAERIAELRNA